MEDQPNFVSHVFNFEKDSRNEMVNIIQYTVIGIILITLLNKGVEEQDVIAMELVFNYILPNNMIN